MNRCWLEIGRCTLLLKGVRLDLRGKNKGKKNLVLDEAHNLMKVKIRPYFYRKSGPDLVTLSVISLALHINHKCR